MWCFNIGAFSWHSSLSSILSASFFLKIITCMKAIILRGITSFIVATFSLFKILKASYIFCCRISTFFTLFLSAIFNWSHGVVAKYSVCHSDRWRFSPCSGQKVRCLNEVVNMPSYEAQDPIAHPPIHLPFRVRQLMVTWGR